MTSAHDSLTDDHVHHWMLDEPANGRVKGRCRGCEEERIYPASPPSTYLRGLAAKRPNRPPNQAK